MGNCEAVTNSSDSALPLRITQRQMYDAVHICVVRDTQELVISLSNGKWGTVRINGEIASVDQGRDLLRELTNASSKEEFPRFGVRDKKTQKVYYEPEFETAVLWSAGLVDLTSQMVEADLTFRKVQPYEFGTMIAIADAFKTIFMGK
jgi:hypothetical protein